MTLSEADNELLTRVGPGTPMGALLRQYWFPVAASQEVETGRPRQLTLMGESLVLFRGAGGKLGLLGERCPHRGTSLAYGLVEPAGLRCPYHGWLFDSQGRCLDQPNEDAEHNFKSKVNHTAYRVAELGGLVFAYLGNDPKSAPPPFDLLIDENVERRIRTALIPCNWLQIVENGLDPIHIEWLHGHYANYRNQLAGAPPLYDVAKHGEIDFDVTDLGIVKRRVNEGRPHTDEDWTVGQLVIFPAALNISNRYFRSMQYRVPVDDTHTFHIWYEVRDGADAAIGKTTVSEAQVYLPDGSFDLDTIDGQDVMAWVTQGPIADRTAERLGSADRGVTVMRRQLFAELEAIAENRPARWSDLGADGKTINLPRRSSSQPVLLERS